MKNRVGVIIFVLISLLFFNYNFNNNNLEKFKDSLDNIDGMEKKMDEMSELETETRMFCKILRHSEDKVQLQDLLSSRNIQFQDNWQKQNKMINNIKKKFIKLKLEKDGKNFIEYNDSRNDKTEQMEKRKQILNKAKDLAESPYNLNVNINNSN
jgi:hypothetical protein|uniref:Uncharacterized protein n=1 Tax=viral metagenome TaxID=1070528 RepID=A0A6C0J8G3_9ZZZZ